MTSSILVIGASSGIGKQTALEFSKNSWNVIAVSRNLKLLKELSSISERKKKFNKIKVSKLDITDSESLKRKNR